MSSNFAVDMLQASGSTVPKYLFAPAPNGNVEVIGSGTLATVSVVSGTPYNLSFNLPIGTNALLSISADCSENNLYSITSIGSYVDISGSTLCDGFNAVIPAATTPTFLFSSITSSPTGPLLTQNSGGTLTFNLRIQRIASIFQA
jgi:hypothetical protein